MCVFLVLQSGVGDRREENLEAAKQDVKVLVRVMALWGLSILSPSMRRETS